MLRIDNISGGYNEIDVVKNVSFHVNKGEILGILGPNGSGKSTLLKLISGIMPVRTGVVEIDGKSISAFKSKELARKMAVLPQLHEHTFSHTVRDTVSLGRYPHQSGLFKAWTTEDEAAVVEAMSIMGVTPFGQTHLDRLSGGERQRVFVAQAFAQQAPIFLLDEPTNHLDIAHQKELLDTIQKLVIEKELTVISIFHDINLASLYCDRLLLMEKGEVKLIGEPHEVVKAEQIEEVYDAQVSVQPHKELPKPQITLLPNVHKTNDQTIIMKDDIHVSGLNVLLQSKFPLKTFTTAGFGWYRNLIINLNEEDELSTLAATDTYAMTTVANTKTSIEQYETSFGNIIIVVTAVIDKTECHSFQLWLIINGKLSEGALIQAMLSTNEAKVSALHVANIKTNAPLANQLLIAATQVGDELSYTAELNKLIERGVVECIRKLI